MIISYVPVRITAGGGGSDLPSYFKKYGGFLIAITINKYIYLILNQRFESDIRLSYSETEVVNNINNIKHNIFRECLKYTDITSGIDICSMSDIPSNSGLGTSSAFTVGLLDVLYRHKGIKKSKFNLAKIACEIEIEKLGAKIGWQDQYATAIGGVTSYIFNKDGTVVIDPISMRYERKQLLEDNIILFYIPGKHNASNILSVQDNNTKNNDPNTIEKLHAIKEIGLYTKKLFEDNDRNLDEFGELLHNHWLNKKKLNNNISNSLVDEVYDVALKNGAIGGKLIGAGSTGVMLFYCPKDHGKLISAISKLNINNILFKFEDGGLSRRNIK